MFPSEYLLKMLHIARPDGTHIEPAPGARFLGRSATLKEMVEGFMRLTPAGT
jgi:hypothetical protein